MARIDLREVPSENKRGHSALQKFGSGIKLPRFMTLREPIQHEDLQGFAEEAAKEDSESKSLDKYIFSRDGKPTKVSYETPFEQGVADILDVQASRLRDLGRRDLIAAKAVAVKLKRVKNKHQAHVNSLLIELTEVSKTVQREEDILSGAQTGEFGVQRESQLPMTSGLQGFFNSYRHVMIFVFVAAVDASVLTISLASLLGNGIEGLFFAIPAIGVQIIFPHYIGKYSARVKDSKNLRRFNLIIALILFAGWGTFIWAVSFLRTTFLKTAWIQEQQQLTSGAIDTVTTSNNVTIAGVFIPIILLGLGIWLILEALYDNPHSAFYTRAVRRHQRLSRKLEKAKSKLETAAEKVAVQSEAIQTLSESIDDHERAIMENFPGFTKKWYRRSLVNAMQDPNFSSEATK